MKKKHPSQHRQALDFIYKELGEEPRTLRKVIEASQMTERATSTMLHLGIRAGVVVVHETDHCEFTRTNVKRTEFRDAIVRQWFTENVPCTNIQAVAEFTGFMSKSQLYYSVARLGDMLTIDRDGTRVPVYTLNESAA